MKENNYPKITVVTVAYNAKEHIEKTIKSVLLQDYPNIEYMIIDGGSSDETINIIKKYENDLSYWVSEPDRGIYDAMNKGIDASTGEWINFLSTGDTFAEQDTLKQVSQYLIDENDLVHGLMWRNKPKRELKAPFLVNEKANGCWIWHPTLFAKTSIMKEIKYDLSFKIAADYDFFFKCLRLNYKVKFIDMAIVDYLENGISQSNNLLTFIEALFIQTKYLSNNDICSSKIFESLFMQYYPNKNLLFNTLQNSFEEKSQSLLYGKQFILYGFGHIGKLIYEKYKSHILFVVDKNFEELNKKEDIVIYSLDKLKDNAEEYIFISVLGREDEISNELINQYHYKSQNILSIKV
ncbi:MAG: glycosyltransferase family 2 protein [Arcobacteraceae bacterium]